VIARDLRDELIVKLSFIANIHRRNAPRTVSEEKHAFTCFEARLCSRVNETKPEFCTKQHALKALSV